MTSPPSKSATAPAAWVIGHAVRAGTTTGSTTRTPAARLARIRGNSSPDGSGAGSVRSSSFQEHEPACASAQSHERQSGGHALQPAREAAPLLVSPQRLRQAHRLVGYHFFGILSCAGEAIGEAIQGTAVFPVQRGQSVRAARPNRLDRVDRRSRVSPRTPPLPPLIPNAVPPRDVTRLQPIPRTTPTLFLFAQVVYFQATESRGRGGTASSQSGSAWPAWPTAGTRSRRAGTLGSAFARVAEARAVSYRLLTRSEMDIADAASVERVL